MEQDAIIRSHENHQKIDGVSESHQIASSAFGSIYWLHKLAKDSQQPMLFPEVPFLHMECRAGSVMPFGSLPRSAKCSLFLKVQRTLGH